MGSNDNKPVLALPTTPIVGLPPGFPANSLVILGLFLTPDDKIAVQSHDAPDWMTAFRNYLRLGQALADMEQQDREKRERENSSSGLIVPRFQVSPAMMEKLKKGRS